MRRHQPARAGMRRRGAALACAALLCAGVAAAPAPRAADAVAAQAGALLERLGNALLASSAPALRSIEDEPALRPAAAALLKRFRDFQTPAASPPRRCGARRRDAWRARSPLRWH
jgi:hypothetical protein